MIQRNNTYIELQAEEGKVLVNKDYSIITTRICLGQDDTINNYKEITVEELNTIINGLNIQNL